jgi:hypothetical protein
MFFSGCAAGFKKQIHIAVRSYADPQVIRRPRFVEMPH